MDNLFSSKENDNNNQDHYENLASSFEKKNLIFVDWYKQ